MEKISPHTTIMEKDPESTTSSALDNNERITEDAGQAIINVTDTERNDVVHYKTMKWWHCGLLMLAETISLGIMALPWAISKLGLFPGLFLIIVMGTIASYNGYIIGQYIRANPRIDSFSAAGAVLFKRWPGFGRELFAVIMVMVLLFIMAAHIVGFQVMMITLAPGTHCTLIWAALGTVVQYIFTIPRTMRNAAYISSASSVSVLIAVIIVMVDTSLHRTSKPPSAFQINPNDTYPSRVTGVMNIVLAYAGHVAYFSFANELAKPEDFNKALFFQLGSATTLYTIVAGVIFYNVGFAVKGLSLSSASPTFAKAAYAIASFTIVMAGVVNAHVAAKLVYTKYFGKYMHRKTFKAIALWNVILIIGWVIAFFLAVVIPSFQHMLSVVSSLFSAFISFGISGLLWFDMNGQESYFGTWRRSCITLLNAFIILLGIFLTTNGMYASISEFKSGVTGRPWSCKANRELH